MAVLFVNVLRPLFVLPPRLLFPTGGPVLVLPVVSRPGRAVAAAVLGGCVKPTELLRDE